MGKPETPCKDCSNVCDHDISEIETICYAEGLCPICLRDENNRLRVIIADIRQALGMQVDDVDILAEIKYLQQIDTAPAEWPKHLRRREYPK